jgi:hypothetical protein
MLSYVCSSVYLLTFLLAYLVASFLHSSPPPPPPTINNNLYQVWGAQSSQAQIFEQVEALALSVVDGYNA